MRSIKLALAAVAFAALLVAVACGSSTSPVTPTPPAPTGGGGGNSTASVTIANFAFAPASITVKAGQTIAWQNNDSTTHTATADGGAFDTGSIAPGATRSITMSAPGTFSYHCAIHPFMTASVTVTQ